VTTQIIVRIIICLLERYYKSLSKEQKKLITEAAKGNFASAGNMGSGVGE
jgi:hypothetical protein